METVKVETVWARTSARTWIRPEALHIATVRRDPKLHPGRSAAARVCRRRRGQDACVLLVQQDDFEIGRVGVVQPSNDNFCLRYQIQQGACTRENACKRRVERVAKKVDSCDPPPPQASSQRRRYRTVKIHCLAVNFVQGSAQEVDFRPLIQEYSILAARHQ